MAKEPLTPLTLSCFGDWFLKDQFEKVYMLDCLFGELDLIANSEDEFWQIIDTQEKQDEWVMTEVVLLMQEKGYILGKEQCYSFKVHPILGGQIRSDNIEIMNINIWQIICSSFSKQIKQMPPGFRVSRVDLDSEGKIKLIFDKAEDALYGY